MLWKIYQLLFESTKKEKQAARPGMARTQAIPPPFLLVNICLAIRPVYGKAVEEKVSNLRMQPM
jgi:hypothetical protein